jgi:glycosyltransferase involved in cell wall biosynthesis
MTTSLPGAPRRRVLILPSWYPRPDSPVEGVFVQDQAVVLARRQDVSVLVPSWPTLRDVVRLRGLGPLSTARVDGVRLCHSHHLLRIPLKVASLLQRATRIEAYVRRWDRALHRGFERFIDRHGRPDLIHAHVVLPTGWVAVRLGRRHGIPVVLTEHSCPFSAHLQSPALRRMTHEALHGAARVVAVSPSLAETINSYFPAVRPEVLGELARTDYFTPASSTEGRGTRTGFFLGALLSERKGVQFVLEAMARLLRQGVTAFDLTIGGDGPFRPALEEQARRLGLVGHCRFLGLLSREQVREQMRRCDVFVLPSLGETFGLVLAEAMACGKPVLATRCGGPDFVVAPETGVLVPPGDAAQLAEAMSGFISQRYRFDPAAVRRSVEERFGIRVLVRNLERIYDEALGRRRAAPVACAPVALR